MVYEVAVLLDGSIVPVDASIDNPAGTAVNVPPVWPPMFRVTGAEVTDLQKDELVYEIVVTGGAGLTVISAVVLKLPQLVAGTL